MKADKHSPHLSRLQECSRTVNEMAANVGASTKSGQEQVEDRGGHWRPRGAGRGWGRHADTDPPRSAHRHHGLLRPLPHQAEEAVTELAVHLPRHTVVPYRNIPKKEYPINVPPEVDPAQ